MRFVLARRLWLTLLIGQPKATKTPLTTRRGEQEWKACAFNTSSIVQNLIFSGVFVYFQTFLL